MPANLTRARELLAEYRRLKADIEAYCNPPYWLMEAHATTAHAFMLECAGELIEKLTQGAGA